MACKATNVYHPDDVIIDLFGERELGKPQLVMLKKAYADEQGIFIAIHGLDGEYRCNVPGCTNRDVQHHHIAHRIVFGAKADKFGTVPLCRQHHAELHGEFRLHVNRGGAL